MADNLTKQIKDQINSGNEQNNEIIIDKESQKFMEIFDRVFSENETESSDLDSEDDIVEDILIAIVKKIKTLIKQKFVKEVLLNEDGENESGSERET